MQPASGKAPRRPRLRKNALKSLTKRDMRKSLTKLKMAAPRGYPDDDAARLAIKDKLTSLAPALQKVSGYLERRSIASIRTKRGIPRQSPAWVPRAVAE